MSPHHYAIRRQAIAAALGNWSTPATAPFTEALDEHVEAAWEPPSEMFLTLDSGSAPFCTISQGKSVQFVA